LHLIRCHVASVVSGWQHWTFMSESVWYTDGLRILRRWNQDCFYAGGHKQKQMCSCKNTFWSIRPLWVYKHNWSLTERVDRYWEQRMCVSYSRGAHIS
jgi:hypothetical protein